MKSSDKCGISGSANSFNNVPMFEVFDKDKIISASLSSESNKEMKPLHDFLTENKMSFEQFIRTVNFVRDMSQEQLKAYIEGYQNGEFNKHGWY